MRHRPILAGLVLATALSTAASAQTPLGQSLFWANGSSFTTFGANEAVTIDLGTIGFACDFIFRTADVYVVPSGSVSGGTMLAGLDPAGTPNTIIGASGGVFVGETIGFTAPTGNIGAGMWAVVYDECQDGVYTPGQDALFDPAFSVVLPVTLPPIDPGIQMIKAGAAMQAQSACDRLADMQVAFAAMNYLDLALAIASLSTGNALPLVYWMASQTAPATDIALDALADNKGHWTGLAADPPDPNFMQVTPLGPTPSVAAGRADPRQRAIERIFDAIIVESRVNGALLSSIERYQGAQAAGNVEWAVVHARASRDNAALLADCLGTLNGALADFVAVASGGTPDLDSVLMAAEADRSRLETQGLNAFELNAFANIGIQAAQAQMLADDFVSLFANGTSLAGVLTQPTTFAGSSEATLIAAAQSMMAVNAATIPGVQSDAFLLDGLLNGIIANPAAITTIPAADAGGPYAALVGVATQLDASNSMDPDGTIVNFEWDLDGDGLFDDASSVTAQVMVTFDAPRETVIGLRVTDDNGNQSVDYAPLVVSDGGNGAPVVTATTPLNGYPFVAPGDLLTLTVVVNDPEGDPVSYDWIVDGVSTGDVDPSFDFSSPTSGLFVVACRIGDASHGPAAVVQTWTVGVSSCPASSTVLGGGLAGALGVPAVALSAPPRLGTQIDLLLTSSAIAPSVACLLIGFDPGPSPTAYGAPLLVGSMRQEILFHQLPPGTTVFPRDIPDLGILCGVNAYVQMVQIDPGAIFGVAFSDGLELTLGQ